MFNTKGHVIYMQNEDSKGGPTLYGNRANGELEGPSCAFVCGYICPCVCALKSLVDKWYPFIRGYTKWVHLSNRGEKACCLPFTEV